MNNNIIRTSALIAAAAFALASCLQMEPAHEETVGYLSAPQFDVDVTVENLTSTKAEDYGIVDPKESDIRFIVKDKDSKVVYDQKGLWTSPLVLPVGAYTVEASAGENGFGIPYFTGSATGTVGALDAEVPALSLSLANALVKVSIDENFALHFTGQKILMDEGAYEASFDEWFYVPAGSDLTLTLVGTNSVENTKEFTDTLSSPAAKTAYSVVYKQSSTNWPEISWSSSTLDAGAFEGGLFFTPPSVSNMLAETAANFTYYIKGGKFAEWTQVTPVDVQGYKYISDLTNDVKYSLLAKVGNLEGDEIEFTPVSFESCISVEASAAHNNAGKPNELLSGTVVSAAVKVNLPSIVNNLATVASSVKFVNSDGQERANLTAMEVNAAKRTLNNADGWPYIPQGAYQLKTKAVCTINGKEITADVSTPVTVSAPEFTLSMSSYTSYDKYAATNNISKNVTEANGCNAETLYNAGAQWGISVDLMKNSNYAKTLVIDIDGNTDRTFNVESYDSNSYYENIGGLSWGQHGLKVSFTFDGTSVFKSQTHHITGLPYKAPSLTKFDNNNYSWTKVSGNKTSISSDVLTLRSGAGDIVGQEPEVNGPKFYIPSNVTANISLDCNIHSQHVALWYRCTLKVKVNGSTIISQESGKNTDNYYTLSNSATFTSSGNYITMETSVYAVQDRYAEISRVEVLYQ